MNAVSVSIDWHSGYDDEERRNGMEPVTLMTDAELKRHTAHIGTNWYYRDFMRGVGPALPKERNPLRVYRDNGNGWESPLHRAARSIAAERKPVRTLLEVAER